LHNTSLDPIFKFIATPAVLANIGKGVM